MPPVELAKSLDVLWLIPAAILFLVLHQAIEGIVCSSGKIARRKFIWNMATAAGMLIGLGTAFWVIYGDAALRQEYGGFLLLVSPFAVIGIGIFAFLSHLVYDPDDDDEMLNEQVKESTS